MTAKEIFVKYRENSKFLRTVSCCLKKVECYPKIRQLNLGEKRRRAGFADPQYAAIQALRDTHKGERCFIVATGPSLTFDDLEMLRGEVCFGMNSICKILDKTSWYPTYYGIQDTWVYDKMQEEIKKLNCPVFVGSCIVDRFDVKPEYVQFPVNDLYHHPEKDIDKYFAKFSDDAYAMVYDGYTITYTLMQIAIYMGFREIYLLGCDCNYPKGEKNHFVESGFVDKYAFKNHERMIVGYEKAKEYADAHGIKIVNCTRGGMLEVYPRMRLEEVLNQS